MIKRNATMKSALSFKVLHTKLVCTIVLLFSVNILVHAQQETDISEWTLQESIQHALDHNIDIQQANLDLDESEIDKIDALGNYLPNITANASNSWNSGLTQNVTTGILEQQTNRSFSLGATASVPLFQGLKNLRQKQRAEITQLASQYSLEQMEDDIMLSVTNAFLDILVNKERLQVLEEQTELTQEQFDNTKSRIEEGAAPAGDSLEIKATQAEEQQQIIEAQNDIRIALINLAQLLQIDDYKNFDVADAEYDVPLETLLSRTPEEVIASAKETRHEIKIAEKDLELAEKDVEIAKSDYYPTLTAHVNFNTRHTNTPQSGGQEIDPDNPTEIIGEVESTGEDVVAPNYRPTILGADPFFDQLSRNKGWDYGLQLSIPILNGFTTRNSVKRNKINVERNRNELKQAEFDLESNVYQAYVDAQGAAKTYEAAQTAVNSKEKAFGYSQERFDVGKITAFEFSQAKFELTDAESNLINAKFDYIFRLKVLELYFGIDAEDINI